MNTRLAHRLLFVQGLAIIALIWALIYFARDEWKLYDAHDDDEVAVPTRVLQKEGGAAHVRLTAAAQSASGIALGAVRAGTGHAVAESPAQVLDIEALLDLRTRWQAAQAETTRLRAQLVRSEAEFARVKALFEDNRNMSERAFQSAAAQLAQDRGLLDAARAQAEGLRAQLLQGWGALGERAAQEAGFERLATRRDTAVSVAVRGADAAPEHIRLQSPEGGETVPARRLGAAPRSLAQGGGVAWLYLSERAWPANTRLLARLPGSANGAALVPDTAVLWHAGLPWMYVRDEDEPEEFVRVALPADGQRPDGWVAPALEEDARVVVRGAQLLLSEELRLQIKDENDD